MDRRGRGQTGRRRDPRGSYVVLGQVDRLEVGWGRVLKELLGVGASVLGVVVPGLEVVWVFLWGEGLVSWVGWWWWGAELDLDQGLHDPIEPQVGLLERRAERSHGPAVSRPQGEVAMTTASHHGNQRQHRNVDPGQRVQFPTLLELLQDLLEPSLQLSPVLEN